MNTILSKYPIEIIIQAAIKFIRDKMQWNEKPRKVIIDRDSLLLIYDDAVDALSHLGPQEDGIMFMYSKGKEKRIAWIEFERFNGLERYIEAPVMVPK